MSDEFDELTDPSLLRRGSDLVKVIDRPQGARVARLVSRLYRAAEPKLRTALLVCLVRPLGSLGLVAVAAGAFAGFLRSGDAASTGAAMDVERFSREQVAELANFVAQVSPEALREFAQLIAEKPVGIAAFSVSAAVLLLHALRDEVPAPAAPRDGTKADPDRGRSD